MVTCFPTLRGQRERDYQGREERKKERLTNEARPKTHRIPAKRMRKMLSSEETLPLKVVVQLK
jgi:hypothetical protein